MTGCYHRTNPSTREERWGNVRTAHHERAEVFGSPVKGHAERHPRRPRRKALAPATPRHSLTPDHGIAVGTALAGGPPRRSQRAGLPHWAPAMSIWRRTAVRERGA